MIASKGIRELACLFWCGGLAVIAVDFLSVPFFEKQVSISYFLFVLSFFFVCVAEKKEYGTRVFLYRLHDVAIFEPWRFLLLYFLWISLFSPFSVNPRESILYALNGWTSLVTIGIGSHFIFCERSADGVILLPKRLRTAFVFYAASVALLMANAQMALFLPVSIPMLVQHKLNLFLYFSIGLPFLLWDFLKDGTRLLPKWLAALTIVLGTATVVLVGSVFFQILTMVSIFGTVAMFTYKRARLSHEMFYLALALLLTGVVVPAREIFHSQGPWFEALQFKWETILIETYWSYRTAFLGLPGTNFLGAGLGLTTVTGVYPRLIAEAGVLGALLYFLFFANLCLKLKSVRPSPRVVVSDIALISILIFLVLISHFIANPYGAYVWVWYAIWAVFSSTARKKKI